MIRRSVFEEVGGFDEGYQLVFSDVELCLRVVKKGYRIVYTPYARLRHYEGRSRGYYMPVNDLLRGYTHMKDLVEAGDPFYNPNLSYSSRRPKLAHPEEEDRLSRLSRIVQQAQAQEALTTH